ncbi:putative signal recognition particle-docking protein FtsY [Blattamonas nauphoetae]|uniref:Signal recognition particle-docking protein FtsY n=1 Tax=Blattamonas nauphoetae TaxID=2049346 RepID=A0ABQ9X8R3_9EUKA|nr:putative signal recognition particle-docking protein FtsY [Blattamonas nauphoetae]
MTRCREDGLDDALELSATKHNSINIEFQATTLMQRILMHIANTSQRNEIADRPIEIRVMSGFRRAKKKTTFEQSDTEVFSHFNSAVPMQKVTVGSGTGRLWQYYEIGPAHKAPLILLPPAGCPATIFFKIFEELQDSQIRLLAVQHPPVKTHDDWICTFTDFISHLNIQEFHLLGCGLGAFLGLLYARVFPTSILSFILLNGYTTNEEMVTDMQKYEFAPTAVLRRVFLEKYEKGNMVTHQFAQRNIASISFVKERMESFQHDELLSDLFLVCKPAFIDPSKVDDSRVTIVTSEDFSSDSAVVHYSVIETFKDARSVLMKYGGDFPMISIGDETAMYIIVHMRQFDSSLLPKLEPLDKSDSPLQPIKADAPISSETTQQAQQPSETEAQAVQVEEATQQNDENANREEEERLQKEEEDRLAREKAEEEERVRREEEEKARQDEEERIAREKADEEERLRKEEEERLRREEEERLRREEEERVQREEEERVAREKAEEEERLRREEEERLKREEEERLQKEEEERKQREEEERIAHEKAEEEERSRREEEERVKREEEERVKREEEERAQREEEERLAHEKAEEEERLKREEEERIQKEEEERQRKEDEERIAREQAEEEEKQKNEAENNTQENQEQENQGETEGQE